MALWAERITIFEQSILIVAGEIIESRQPVATPVGFHETAQIVIIHEAPVVIRGMSDKRKHPGGRP